MELQTTDKEKTLEAKDNGEMGTAAGAMDESRTYQLVKTGALVSVWICFVSAFLLMTLTHVVTDSCFWLLHIV